MESKDIKQLTKQNLKRILKIYGLQQNHLAKKINVTPEYLNRLIKSDKGISNSIISKICNALKIRPSEFYIEPETPIVTDSGELTVLNAMRTNPESKTVLLKISEAYKEENTGDTTRDEDSTIPTEGGKRRKKPA